ncbi:transglycosylase domain-containing protein [Peribacillus alkalitolerans]|uniref:transglycosylase domain-containing protein n=1 Tax=Peribacillus alkalitolerans TaxID=1550385 RepID=UPI0013D4D9B2|nr:PBP1A family penicillin-binding protein [Peribacillus alkalitolerans]
MSEQYKTREEKRKQAQGKKVKKKQQTGLIKKIFLSLIALAIVGMVIGVGTFAFFVSDAPKVNEAALKDPLSTKVLDRNNKVVFELGKENREYVPFDEIPKTVEEAFLATEDVRFYKHHGVDILRLGSAVIANVTQGFGSQGASTITQQLVKRSFLTPDKTLKRKAQELWLSFQIEQKYTKEEIFEMYVNKIYFGEGAYGVATASKMYFGKELKDLTLEEAALLAGLPQSPNNYSPFDNPERGKKRRDIVLMLMNKHGFISKEQMEKAQSTKIDTALVKEDKGEKDTAPYDAFIDQIIDEVEDIGKDLNIFTDGLEIHTTLDTNAQEYVYNMLNSDDIINYPSEDFQAGLTVLDTKTGEILAIGGGRNQKVKRGFNYATDLKRQPGSTIKPILDYGPAIEYLKWSTYEQIVDEPYTYSDGTKINNYNKKHLGQVSARDALAKSLNIPALKAMQAVGKDKARNFGVKLGLPLKEDMYESNAIGGGDLISPMQLAGAYSAFGNNGIYTKPHAVRKIVFKDKDTEITTKPKQEVVMKDYTAFMVTDMLKSVVKYGSGRAANISGLPLAGKTGTTNYSSDEKEKWDIPSGAAKDAWFAGYTTNYTIAVWNGYSNQKEYLGNDSQQLAKKMFKNVMSHLSEDVETKDFKKPSSVKKVSVEKGSNPPKLPSKYTPDEMIVNEYFVKGTEPTKVSETFDKLDSPKDLKASYKEDTNEIMLEWKYPQKTGGEDESNLTKPTFEVKVSLDEGPEKVLSLTEDMALMLLNPIGGGTYTFKVTAILGDQKSEPASTTITIPDPMTEAEDQVEEGQPDGEGEGQGEDGDGTTGEFPGTLPGTTPPGNGNGTGNGNGNGNGNGGNNGQDGDDDGVSILPDGTTN